MLFKPIKSNNMKVHDSKQANWIRICDLEECKLAVIRKWHQKKCVGRVCIVFEGNVIFPGGKYGEAYDTLDETTRWTNGDCMVEVLKPGTMFEV